MFGALCCLLVFTLALFANDVYRLKYKMKEGTKLTYERTLSSEALQEMMGSEQTSESEANARVSLTSNGTDEDGNLVFTMAYDALELKIFSVQFDSTFKDPEGMVGKRIKKTIQPNGDQVQSVEVDSFKSIRFASTFTSDQELLPNLPTAKLKMNEPVTFEDVDSTRSFGGQIISKTSSEYTLVGKESRSGYDCLKIAYVGILTLEGEGSRMGMNFFMEGDGDLEGTLYFAPDEGLLVDSEGVADMEMTVAITGQQNMTIPITQTLKTRLKLVK